MKPWFGASLGIGFSLWLGGCVQPQVTPVVVSLTAPIELAYVHGGQVWLYDAETDTHQPITSNATLTSNAVESQPAILADGTAVLFVQAVGVQTTQPYYELWEYTVATQTGRLLATHETSPTQLRLAPNGQFVTYLVDDVLYLTELQTAISTRLHEGATAAAWSPNSRRIIYSTTDQRLLSREFDVTSKLTEPETLLEQAASALVFSSNHSLVFAGDYEDEFAVVEYDLNAATLTPVTSLRFPTAALGQLQLDPSGQRLLYSRTGATKAESAVWLLYLKKDLSKELLTGASSAVWSNVKDTIYYQTLEPLAVMQTTVTGLNHSALVEAGSSITTTATLGSNELTP